jgi:hypothetical protein
MGGDRWNKRKEGRKNAQKPNAFLQGDNKICKKL